MKKTAICPECKKEFIPAKTTSTFCSPKCYGDHTKNENIKTYNQNPKKCLYCGILIKYDNKSNNFCSSSCSAKYNNKKRKETGWAMPETAKKQISEKLKINKQNPIKIKNKYQHTKIKYSPITGNIYHPKLKPATGWDNPTKLPIAKKLANIFNFQLGNQQTQININNSIKELDRLYTNEKMSAKEIKNYLKIQYSDFGMFLKIIGINLRTLTIANQNYRIQSGTKMTDKKKIYKKECKFLFDVFLYPNIQGYDLLLKYGFYNSTNNKQGVCRDHIISVEYGWRNNIDPKIISHPANCQLLSNLDNITKGTGIGMSIEELIKKIQTWDKNNIQPIVITSKHLSKTQEHKEKISASMSGKIYITNGIINTRLNHNDTIPEGFWRGMTRHKK
jgi:hypothetical protein